MTLIEKFVYSFIAFLGIYVLLSLALRLFEITTSYTSHMIGGFVGLFVGLVIFMYLLIGKK